MNQDMDAQPNTNVKTTPLRSVFTENFPEILRQIGASVFVTTYQAGKLVMLRAEEDGGLNTHFRGFNKPMGLAIDGDRLAIGTALEIWEYHNAPAVAARLAGDRACDACYLPRGSNVTGDMFIHEMAWDDDGELWFVNTRFSCLATRSGLHSFVPRWRPSFITQLAPEDRCHLNGLAMVDGVPRYVTAMGQCDQRQGWRECKADGGVLMDVASGETIVRGLSMPHSPRWYGNNLWVLDSGSGGVGIVDPSDGRYQTLAELPGFTRGLDFCGPYAFVGLSQVRETAIFSGIPITGRDIERTCGVWVLDVFSGQTVAFLRFEEAVQEIFAVQVLPGGRWPDVINDDNQLIADSFVLPDHALNDVPESLRFRVGE